MKAAPAVAGAGEEKISKALAFDNAESAAVVEGVVTEPMHVYCRVRPLDSARKASVATIMEDAKTLKLEAPKSSAAFKNGETEESFQFHKVFGPTSNQREVFDEAAFPILSSLVTQDCHGLIFTFGVTNSGKSYTIHGPNEAPNTEAKNDNNNNNNNNNNINGDIEQERGILPRALQCIFNSIKKEGDETKRLPLDDANYRYAVVVNYLEIYNELIFDLLAETFSSSSNKAVDAQKEALELKMDVKGRIGVRGLRDVTVTSYEHALQVLQQGRDARRVAETKLNADSSRSHSVFTIKLCTVPREHVVPMATVKENPGKYVRYTKLSVVDLAGSERAKRTNNQGARLQEASNINLSLTTFKRCIDALRYNQQITASAAKSGAPLKPVPFRESKLTRLFQDYFCGHGKAAMIVNVNPQLSDYDETCRVLKFCATAQELRTAVSRIDTGRVPGGKTRARVHGADGFDGDPTVVGVTASAPSAATVTGATTATAKTAPDSVRKAAASTSTSSSLSHAAPESARKATATSSATSSMREIGYRNDPQLEKEIARLRSELAEALAAHVRLEASIREEVASEFAQEIFHNQLQCEERVTEIREALEEKYEKKIQILDELNKTNVQRHAAKYQELVAEYNDLADEYESREAELQQKLDVLLAVKESGSVAKYHELIAQLETQKSILEVEVKNLKQRVEETEASKQEWKKQVGHIAENRIAQLEREAAELREENRILRSGAGGVVGASSALSVADDKKRSAKNLWVGLKKKHKSGEVVNNNIVQNVAAAAAVQEDQGEVEESPANADGWANVSLDADDEQDKQGKGSGAAAGAKGGKKKFAVAGSWRKRKNAPATTSAANVVPTSHRLAEDEFVDGGAKRILAGDNNNGANAHSSNNNNAGAGGGSKKVKVPGAAAADPAPLKRKESDSMCLSELLHLENNANGNTGKSNGGSSSSPLLQKRSISRSSGALALAADINVPVIQPQKKGTTGGTRSRKPATKYLF